MEYSPESRKITPFAAIILGDRARRRSLSDTHRARRIALVNGIALFVAAF
jgi:hypothetical protein